MKVHPKSAVIKERQVIKPVLNNYVKRRNRSTIIQQYRSCNCTPLLQAVDNIHKHKTAWIFGSGVTLNDVVEWDIPDNVITIALNAGVMAFWKRGSQVLYSGVNPKKSYSKRLDYFFSFDLRVCNSRYFPEWEYFNIAIRHPSAKIMLPDYFPSYADCKNIFKFRLQDKRMKFYKPYKGHLITGDSIITPALHYCYLTGVNRIFLSGIDMCYLRSGQKFQRYNDTLVNMKHQGVHKTFSTKEITAPNGERVKTSVMYNRHMVQVMSQIRLMQESGIEFYKTSLRGMLPINAIDSEKVMRAILNGDENIRYEKNGKPHINQA